MSADGSSGSGRLLTVEELAELELIGNSFDSVMSLFPRRPAGGFLREVAN